MRTWRPTRTLRSDPPMKPPPFSYHDPTTVEEAVGLLNRLDNAKLLAGGQSLMPMLNMRFVLPDHVIDLNRVEGLSYIKESGGALEIGAMTRQRDIEYSDLVKAKCPLLHQAIMQIGHRPTRNRGTVGVAPVRARDVEQAIAGQAPAADLFRKACESCRVIEATEDIHASASYRQHLAAVLSRRALERAAGISAPPVVH